MFLCAHSCECLSKNLSERVILCMFYRLCLPLIPMLVLTPTLSKQTLECLPYEVRNESVFTRELTVSPLAVTDRSVTVFYRKVCW